MNILIAEKKIQARIQELASLISLDYKHKVPVIVGVLNGSFILVADLVRKLTIDYEVDFIKISSYGDSLKSSGSIKLDNDLKMDIKGRDIILVEDIIDSGLSINFLVNHFRKFQVESLSILSLLIKPNPSNLVMDADYIGFEINNDFVIGYGMDYKGKFRGLNSIYTIKQDKYE